MLIKLAVAMAACGLLPSVAGKWAGQGRISAIAATVSSRKPLPEMPETAAGAAGNGLQQGGAGIKAAARTAGHGGGGLVDLDALPDAPGAPGTWWRDDKGRLHRAPADVPRRAINPHESALRFVGWLRDMGYTGWMLSEDACDHYSVFCREQGLEEMLHDDIRARLADMPGVIAGRRRVNGPQFVDLRRYLARTGRLRTVADLNRFELYRIDSHEEMAEQAKAATPRAVRQAKAGCNQPKDRTKTVSMPPARRAA